MGAVQTWRMHNERSEGQMRPNRDPSHRDEPGVMLCKSQGCMSRRFVYNSNGRMFSTTKAFLLFFPQTDFVTMLQSGIARTFVQSQIFNSLWSLCHGGAPTFLFLL